jgi:tetratricopeptide (TPR) repeat protein
MRVPEQRPAKSAKGARERMLAVLSAMPDPVDPAFPHAIRRALEEFDDPEPALRAIVEDHSVRHRPRFAALYSLLLRLRREERYGEYGALVREFESGFGAEPYYQTFRAMVAWMKGDLASLRSAVEHSRQAVALMPDSVAVVHQLAAFWVEYLERLGSTASARDIDEVERHIDRAILLSHGELPHYFETKGRVLALRDEFEAARSAVARAIEYEPRTSRDYLRRLAQYQATRLRIDLLEERTRWAREQARFQGELAAFKAEQLQLLGLLASVVALVATAANIAGQVNGPAGIRLMMAASGAIAVVFGTFSLVNNSRVPRVVAAIATGCALIGIGLFLPGSLLPH